MAKKTARTTKKKAPTARGASKKTASKKKVSKKPAPKYSASKKAVSKKLASKKPAAKKAGAKKTSSKKASSAKASTTKKASSSSTAKKAGKKTTKKAVQKKTAKKAADKSQAKPTSKKTASAQKPAAKKTSSKKASGSKAPAPQGGGSAAAGAGKPKDGDGKPTRKGITIVSDRPMKKKKKVVRPLIKPPQLGDRLLGSGSKKRAPLIPSGPSQAEVAKKQRDAMARSTRKTKYPFTAADLKKYREILLKKRAELYGDMSSMESDALMSSSGDLSSTPQHIAEQGSDSYDQSLSLDLAAADRKLIIEIDAALERIRDKTFGLCELTGKVIKKTRLEELPWARYTIEAATELERRSGGFRP